MLDACSEGRPPYRNTIVLLALLVLPGCYRATPTDNIVTVEPSDSALAGKESCFLKSYAVPTSTVVFSPDGKMLVTAGGPWERMDGLNEGGRGEVCIWDVASGERKALCTGYNSFVLSAAIFPGGKRLVSGGSDVQYSGRGAPWIQGELRIWDLNGKQEWISKVGSKVAAVAVSPDRKTLALAGWGGEVMLWNLVRRSGRRLNPGKQGVVDSVAFSPDGKLLASGGCVDNLLTLWDVEAKKELVQLQGHKGFVRRVVFTPDGKFLASASQDGTVKLWDISTRNEVASLAGPGGKLQGLALSPDGKFLAAGGENKIVKLWDMASRQEVKRLSHKAEVFSLAFSPSSKVLAAGGADHHVPEGVTPGGVTLWDVESGQDITPPT